MLATGLANMYRQDRPYASGRKQAYQASGDAEPCVDAAMEERFVAETAPSFLGGS